MKCKDIPDRPILEFLAKLGRLEITSSYEVNGIVTNWQSTVGGVWPGTAHSVAHAMPLGALTPEKLIRAKMGMLIRRGLVSGCVCGCRGDFELTPKGALVLEEVKP